MIATDETKLREMLDERGIPWRETISGHTGWETEYGDDAVTTGADAGLVLLHAWVTPEQAIAATLYNGEYERKMDALLCRLTNGKFSKTRTYDLDFMESVVREELETDG